MNKAIVLGAKCPICGSSVEHRICGFPNPPDAVAYICTNELCHFEIAGRPNIESAIQAAWRLLENADMTKEVRHDAGRTD